MSIEYSETFIGECSRGCGRPATVRIHGEYVVCALHYRDFEASEKANEAGLALDLMKAWRSEAEFHGCLNLVSGLDRIAEDERKQASEAEEELKMFDRAERESEPNHEIRARMGEKWLAEEKEGRSGQEAASDDGWPGTEEERAEFDARAEVEAWELARKALDLWVKASEPIGSPELTKVMEKALAEVNDTVERAREEWEKARGELLREDG